MKSVLKREGRIGITTIGLKHDAEFYEVEGKVLKKGKLL